MPVKKNRRKEEQARKRRERAQQELSAMSWGDKRKVRAEARERGEDPVSFLVNRALRRQRKPLGASYERAPVSRFGLMEAMPAWLALMDEGRARR